MAANYNKTNQQQDHSQCTIPRVRNHVPVELRNHVPAECKVDLPINKSESRGIEKYVSIRKIELLVGKCLEHFLFH